MNGRFPAPAGRCVTSTFFGRFGIVRKEAKEATALEPVPCRSGLTATAPGARYCSVCGRSFSEDGKMLIEDLTRDVQDNPNVVEKLLNVLIEEKRRQER